MIWLGWTLFVVIVGLAGFGWGHNIGRKLTENRLAAWSRSLATIAHGLREREAELSRDAEKRLVTTLEVHEQTHGRPVYVRPPPEHFIRFFQWNN